MNLLLDTHVALWAIADSPRLSPQVRTLIVSPKTTVWVSAASLWEITLKHALGRGGMPLSGHEALGYFRDAGYRLLPVDAHHTVAVGDLPTHHQDPFDRILVAQALLEPMRLVTHDPLVARYGDTIISA
ncbi:type II toxin-antitoxin system VapC family toxin [Acidiferrobacter sp.]|uniref:type II toxin-antitoxin system VapC family toxin n=1 Tax=Acidiferrobacter sp. TaxID=1872107 RepID=UPI00260A49E6|nr:type II toxin-antitoxin system VapC family toxin [Acidiferrobacter sp.]